MAKFISRCLDCQQVKVEGKYLDGLLQPIEILEWKWEVTSLDFITSLVRKVRQHDSIMVMANKLDKVTQFIPMKTRYSGSWVTHVFIKEIMIMHVVAKNIVLDMDGKFTSRIYEDLFVHMGTQLAFRTTYHP